jgi:hypothetical protein
MSVLCFSVGWFWGGFGDSEKEEQWCYRRLDGERLVVWVGLLIRDDNGV